MNLPKRNKETYKPSKVLIQQPGFQINSPQIHTSTQIPSTQIKSHIDHECRKNRRRHL